MNIFTVHKEKYTITTDKSKLDIAVVHDYLCNQSYWVKGIGKETLKREIDHSLCFGVFHQHTQIGFARVITDFTSFAYLCDVFIIEAYRGKGLSKWLMQSMLDHPELQNLRRWTLYTLDAHGLYKQFGFGESKIPERFMEKHNPDFIKNNEA